MANTPSNQFVDYPVFNQLIPKEGPKTLPFSFDFTAQSSYFIDLQLQQSRQFISIVQAVYCRNPGTSAVTIVFDVAGQTIEFPPQSAGYLPVLVTNPPRFTVSSPGGAINVQLMLLNVPMPAAIWPIVTYITPVTGGAVIVSDPALESAVSNGLVASRQFITDDVDAVKPRMFAGGAITGTKATIGNTIILAADAAKGFVITSVNLHLSGNATLAAAGQLTINLNRSGTVIWSWEVTLPAAAIAGSVIIPICTMDNLHYLSPVVNQNLQVNLSVALATGVLNWNIGAFTTATLR